MKHVIVLRTIGRSNRPHNRRPQVTTSSIAVTSHQIVRNRLSSSSARRAHRVLNVTAVRHHNQLEWAEAHMHIWMLWVCVYGSVFQVLPVSNIFTQSLERSEPTSNIQITFIACVRQMMVTPDTYWTAHTGEPATEARLRHQLNSPVRWRDYAH